MSVPKFYSMNGKHSKKWAVARTEQEFDHLALRDLIETLKSPDQWNVIQFTLDKGELTDLQPTDVIGRICSPKLVEILKGFKSDIMWLPVNLRRDRALYVYHFMHFSSVPDVLDETKTFYVGDHVFTPHLSLAKASELPLFCLSLLAEAPIVRGDVKEAIEKAGCVGIEFETVAAT